MLANIGCWLLDRRKMHKGMWLVVWWWVAHCTLCTEGSIPPPTEVSAQSFSSPSPSTSVQTAASHPSATSTTSQKNDSLLAEPEGTDASPAVPHPPVSLLPPVPPPSESDGRSSVGSSISSASVGPPSLSSSPPALTTTSSTNNHLSSSPSQYDILPTLLATFNDSGSENGTFIGNCSELAIEELLELSSDAPTLGPWAVTAIASSLLAVTALIAAVTFMLYRHSLLWNRPQTLSDKCSNDESTGYIDDSAFRENSEELYSLDNDSFLNSLEAMTIQNYWTEHVKHTKL